MILLLVAGEHGRSSDLSLPKASILLTDLRPHLPQRWKSKLAAWL